MFLLIFQKKMGWIGTIFVGGARAPLTLLSCSEQRFGTKGDFTPFIKPAYRSISFIIWAFPGVASNIPDIKWNESGFRPSLCTYRLNWARRTSWGWWDDWDDTVLQTQDSKFEPWQSEAEHATSRSRRLPTILTFTRGWGRNIFSSRRHRRWAKGAMDSTSVFFWPLLLPITLWENKLG